MIRGTIVALGLPSPLFERLRDLFREAEYGTVDYLPRQILCTSDLVVVRPLYSSAAMQRDVVERVRSWVGYHVTVWLVAEKRLIPEDLSEGVRFLSQSSLKTVVDNATAPQLLLGSGRTT